MVMSLLINRGNIYDIDYIKAGKSYTFLLEAHVARNQRLLEECMAALGMSLYGLNPEEASRLARAQRKAFEAHNAAESEDTPQEERRKYWKMAERSLVEYFEILKPRFHTFGISINPRRLARNEVVWWKYHNAREKVGNRDRLVRNLTRKHMMLYKLSFQQARNAACMEVGAMEAYDSAKKGNDKRLWRKVLSQNVLAFYALQQELTNKLHGE